MVAAAAVSTQEVEIAGTNLERSAGRAVAAGEDDRAAGGGIEGQPVARDQHAVASLDILVGGLGHAAPAGHADPCSLDDPLPVAGNAHIDRHSKIGHGGGVGHAAHLGIIAGVADDDHVNEAVCRRRPAAVGVLVCHCKLLVQERME